MRYVLILAALALAGCQTTGNPVTGDPGAALGGRGIAGGSCACDPEPVGQPDWGGDAGDYAGGMANADNR